MTFIIEETWRVKSHDYQGYMVQRRIGQQWKEASYFNTLAQAANWLLERRVHHESTDIIINSTHNAEVAIKSAELLSRIDGIRDEIVGVFNGR